MAQNNTPIRALVLAGGGARGSYQVGVWRALAELGWRAPAWAASTVRCSPSTSTRRPGICGSPSAVRM